MILDIVFALIMIVCIVLGFKRGLVRSVCSVFSFLISFVVAFISYDKISAFVTASPVGKFISDKISGSVALPTMDLSSMPELVRKPLEVSVHATDTAVNTLTHNFSQVIIGVISVIITIVLVKIAVKLIFKLFDVVAKLPVIKQCNGILGGAFGVVNGIFWICIVSVAVTYLSLVPAMSFLQELSQGSYLLTAVMNNEFIVSVLPFANK